jgi:hypothetical protein
MEGLHKVNLKLTTFKRKYYLNLLLRGLLLTMSLMLLYFLVASLVEYNLWLGGWARFIIFFSFFALVVFCVYKFLKEPLSWWLYQKGIDQEQSARLIGAFFPDVNDRLLNLIQLGLLQKQTALTQAGIAQKSAQFETLAFENAIDLNGNKRYLKYFLIPFFAILLLFIFDRRVITQSTQRIVQFNHEFAPQAPFQFVIQNKSLDAFFNEDYTLSIKIVGEALPDAAYLVSKTQRLKLESVKPGEFEYTFEKIQGEIIFQLEAAGFFSNVYTLQLVNRPELTQLKMTLDYPRYLNRRREELLNTGNTEVPEGTRITWRIATSNATRAYAGFSSGKDLFPMQNLNNQLFMFSKGFNNPEQYWIELQNDHSKNKDKISYAIQVVKDQYPEIRVDHLKDSVLYRNIFLGGTVSDDYGVTELALHYQIVRGGKQEDKKINLPLNHNPLQQSFFYQWHLDSLRLDPGDKLNYYMQVWDNDGVNGRKSSKSSVYVFALPGEEALKAEISKSQSAAENKIGTSLQKAKELREKIDGVQQKLKGKQVLDWQDKKMLEDLLDQKRNLDQMINQLQKQNELLEQKKDAFSKEDEKIREKANQIQKLMDELLDPETKKMFEELEKLLKENSDINQLQKMLDKMNRKEINLEKELERTLELFKQMQFDYKLDQAINNLREQKQKQEELLEKTEKLAGEKAPEEKLPGQDDKKGENQDKAGKHLDKSGQKDSQTDGDKDHNGGDKEKSGKDGNQNDQKPDIQDLAKEQEALQPKVDQFQKEMDDLDKMAEDLKKEMNSPSKEEIDQVKDSQQKSKESLQQDDPKKSLGPQRKTVSQMKQMQQKLEGMQNSMEMEVDMQNLETLRQIVHGLIKLSYDQESLMKDFNQIQQTDPKYIQLSQNQLKVKDDSKILEDSLLSLAKRDPFMGSIVTKEIGELNSHLDKAAEHVRERRKPNAASEMQLSMTSINNLALMLNDHFDMMMEMLANAMPMPGKKKGKLKQPGLGQLQQQLNEKIQDLKNGNKSGRQYSEELAKVAAEQERIRRALQEMQEKLKQEGGKTLGNDLPGKMEQTEMDLVNKQITEQTIRRQKEIETRLLEAEKSMREQNMDEERKGETAKDYDKEIPKAFEDYLRLKEKEVELLKSMPPKLYPYYKHEVNEYFKRIRNQN